MSLSWLWMVSMSRPVDGAFLISTSSAVTCSLLDCSSTWRQRTTLRVNAPVYSNTEHVHIDHIDQDIPLAAYSY